MQSKRFFSVLAIAGFGLVLMGAACTKNANQNSNQPSLSETPGSGDGTDTIDSGGTTSSNTSINLNTNTNQNAGSTSGTTNETKIFNVEGGMYYFNPKEIRVKRGDKVKIVFSNKEGMHDWVIDELNVRTPQIQAGNIATVEFVASKTGTFEYYCSVGNHRAMGMKGKLIVE